MALQTYYKFVVGLQQVSYSVCRLVFGCLLAFVGICSDFLSVCRLSLQVFVGVCSYILIVCSYFLTVCRCLQQVCSCFLLMFVGQHFPLFSVYSSLLCVLNLIMGLPFKLSSWPVTKGTMVAHKSGLRIGLSQKIKKLTICLLAFVDVCRPTNGNKHEQGLQYICRHLQ